MYTAIGFMPKSSVVLLIDESSAALASRMGHSIAVTSFGARIAQGRASTSHRRYGWNRKQST